MALTLVATAGAADANSYATVAEGTAYHEGRLHNTAWEDASPSDRAAALVWATRILEAKYAGAWVGWPTYTTQALAHPRRGLVRTNGYDYIPENIVAQEIKNATIELSRLLLAEDRAAESDIQAQGITSLKAGPVFLQFKDDLTKIVVPEQVTTLIPSWWFEAINSGFNADIVRR
jgi:hypothetical protein